MNTFLKLIIAPVVGCISYLFCMYVFNLIFPELPAEDWDEQVNVMLIGLAFIVIMVLVFLLFQYKVIIPKTRYGISTKTIKVILAIGIILALLCGSLNFFGDHAGFKESAITILRTFVEFESFWVGNLMMIYIANNVTEEYVAENL